MEITHKTLIDLINNIGKSIDKLNTKIINQESEIDNLKLQNRRLNRNNHNILERIKEYIEELEQIKIQYVDSNNNISEKKV